MTDNQKKNRIIAKIAGAKRQANTLFKTLQEVCKHRKLAQGPGTGIEYEYMACTSKAHIYHGTGHVGCGNSYCPLLMKRS